MTSALHIWIRQTHSDITEDDIITLGQPHKSQSNLQIGSPHATSSSQSFRPSAPNQLFDENFHFLLPETPSSDLQPTPDQTCHQETEISGPSVLHRPSDTTDTWTFRPSQATRYYRHLDLPSFTGHQIRQTPGPSVLHRPPDTTDTWTFCLSQAIRYDRHLDLPSVTGHQIRQTPGPSVCHRPPDTTDTWTFPRVFIRRRCVEMGASASGLRPEDHLQCSVCMDLFSEPVTTPCGHNYCNACITRCWDAGAVCRCPLCNKTFHTRPELSVNTLVSEMVQQFRNHKVKEEYEAKTEAEIQTMIQERRVKIQEFRRSVELSRRDADTVITASVQVFAALISCIERSQAELIGVIEEKQKTTEKQADGFIKDLKKEITQLEKRSSELKQPSHSEDHLIQNVTSINTPPPTKDWTKVSVHQSLYVETVRTAVSQLEKTLSQEMKKMCDVEMKWIQQCAVNVTLDPDTAHPNLILSDDGKQVHCGNIKKNLPNNKKRFSPCACVLGKQGFCSGRFYYEVQVGGKTDWDLGVARESINRKGVILPTPNNGYWTIGLRNGNDYSSAVVISFPVRLPVREKLQTVGVFVDYEEGLVSFHDVETRVHLYSFTGCSFTERLYPFFSPHPNNGGINSAPMIISPVNMEKNRLS